MLVLRRESEEAILIGDDIRIVVLSIHAGCVVLGIQAPSLVSIVREELSVRHRPPKPQDD